MRKLVLLSVSLLLSTVVANAASSDKYKDDVLKGKPKDEPVKQASWLDNLSGTMALTSNYMFRGISQSNNKAAAQGGLTYTFPIGIYLSLWGSSIDYAAPNGAAVNMELDTLAGLQGGYGDNFSYDVNVVRYNYPRARYANYNELNTLWTLYFFTLGLSYTSDYAGYHGYGKYINGTVNFDIPAKYALSIEDLSIAAEAGHYSLARVGGNSYSDYSVTLSKKINDTYTIAAMWTGTDGRAHLPPIDNNQLVGTVTATF